jgi:hypothetical protein
MHSTGVYLALLSAAAALRVNCDASCGGMLTLGPKRCVVLCRAALCSDVCQ